MSTTKNTSSSSSGSRSNAPNRNPTLSEQTSKVAEDVRELGNIALSTASEAISSVKDRGGEAVEGARERGQEMFEKSQDRLQNARDDFEDYVADYPLKSVLIAAGIGLFLGFTLRGR